MEPIRIGRYVEGGIVGGVDVCLMEDDGGGGFVSGSWKITF